MGVCSKYLLFALTCTIFTAINFSYIIVVDHLSFVELHKELDGKKEISLGNLKTLSDTTTKFSCVQMFLVFVTLSLHTLVSTSNLKLFN